MEDIIRQVYAQWRVAKEQARQECDSRSLPNMAEKYRMCDMFKGTEDLQSLIRLFTSPQGMEFCIKHRFPNIATSGCSSRSTPKSTAFTLMRV